MTPMSHRAPGVPGAVLAVARCRRRADLRWLPRASGTDAARDSRQGPRPASWPSPMARPVRDCRSARGRSSAASRSSSPNRTAELEDGTLAGSVLTMDGAFRTLVRRVGVPRWSTPRGCARRRRRSTWGCEHRPDCGGDGGGSGRARPRSPGPRDLRRRAALAEPGRRANV